MSATEFKNKGNRHFQAGEHKEAIEAYTKAIELEPNNHVFYSNRSASYAALNDWDRAAADGIRCVDLDPTFLKGYHRAAKALKELNRLKEGIALLEKGLVHFPGQADFLEILEPMRAEYAAQEKARRAGLSREESLKEAGNDLFKAAKFEDAIHKYTDAYNACADKESAVALAILNNRAACHQQLSNFQAVVQDTSVVLEHEPKNLKALLRRGLAFEGLEKYRSALADIRAVLESDPSNQIANAAQHRIGTVVQRLRKEGRNI